MQKKPFKWLASMTFFTLGSIHLLGTNTNYYVSNPTEPLEGTSCTDCPDITGSCCSFLDAFALANAITAPDSSTIHITVPITTYSRYSCPACNEVELTTIQSSSGSAINFNKLSCFCASGVITLNNVVLQNSSSVDLYGGSLTITGTKTLNGYSFYNNTWFVAEHLSNQPALTFGVSDYSDYSTPFTDDFLYITDNTTLTLTNDYSNTGPTSISGDIICNSTSGSILNYSNGSAAGQNALYLTGSVSTSTVNVQSGGLFLQGTTNRITTLNVESAGQLYLQSSESVSSVASTLTMNGGQLVFGDNFTLANTISLNLASTPFINDGGYNTGIASVISGVGGFNKNGTGILTLTNSNSFSGGVGLYEGTLSIPSEAVLGAGGFVTLYGGNLFGSSTQTLASTMIFLATNGGGLSAATGTTLTISSLLADAGTPGTLTIGNSHGSLSSSGTVALTGGSNTFTGPLTIGTYIIEDTGSVNYPATLSINSMANIGTPTSLTLQGLGVFATTSSFSTNIPIFLGAGGGLFSPSIGTTLTVSGDISGFGSLIKSGSGALLLTANSTYSGKTYVNEGALIVNGNIVPSGDPIVAVGALLSGTGTIGDTAVFGTLKGGNPLGTLTITGSLTLEEGSNFGTIISSGNQSFVAASGPVTINSNTTYLLAALPGGHQTSSVVVLSGSSITGQFSNLNSLNAAAGFLSSSLSYTDTEVILDLTARSITPLITGQNAINVAEALDAVIASNRRITYTIEPSGITASSPPELVQVLLSLLPFRVPEGMTYALNQLHPAQLKGMAISQENNAALVRESISQRMQMELDLSNCLVSDNYDVKDNNCCGKNKKIMTSWISGIGESFGQTSENNHWGPLSGYRVNTGGFTAGIDGMFAEHFYAGALGGYTHSHLHWKDSKGRGDINSGYAGLYLSALALGKLFYGNASLIGSWSHYSADRHIKYGAVDLVAKNGHGGNQLLSHLDTGINFDYLGLTIRPFDSFDYITQIENGYQESNAGQWDLSVNKMNAIMIRNELGLELSKCYCIFKSKWIVSPKLSWVREARVKGDDFTVNFTEGGPSFQIGGYFPDRSLFAPGLSITGLVLQDTLTFDLHYNGEFTNGYSSNNYGGQVRYSF